MSSMTFFRTTFLTVLLSFAVGHTSFASQKETPKAANKADSKKTKAAPKTKQAASPAKVKAENKVTKKPEPKQKTKPKNTATNKPKKEPNKLATADTFAKEEGGLSLFKMFLVIAGVAFVGTICFAIWLDYRPTVYPSGKVYGTHEFLQSPFTTEIGGVQKHKTTPTAAKRTPIETTDKANQLTPVTVTREPVNKSVKHPPAKAG